MLTFQLSVPLYTAAKNGYDQILPRGRRGTSLRRICTHSAQQIKGQTIRNSVTLPGRLQKLCDSVNVQEDDKGRYLKLVSLGNEIPQLDEAKRTDETRVAGCTSVTHVDVGKGNDGCLSLRGYSDAQIARGLLALLVLGFDGATTEQVHEITAEAILSASGLKASSLISRQAGIVNILHAVKAQVSQMNAEHTSETAQLAKEEEVHTLQGRWSDRQGEDVAVLLSGGVDSSVALRLALESGARVQAYYLKIWLDDETAHLGECPWEDDMHYARAVCEQAGVRLHDVPFQNAYWDQVVSYTVDEARKGHTPNPDIMCNTRIKFGAFFDKFGQDFDKVVTGHYARRATAKNGLAQLRLSNDAVKDQTYFLAHLQQAQLAKASFPLGEMDKKTVRQMAIEYDLPNRFRKDSQGICFLGKLKFDEFLEHHLGQKQGTLVEFETGCELGQHKGFWFFTVGQRRGIGLSGGPWHVVAKDVSANVVYVSKEYNSTEKERKWFDMEHAVWISGSWPDTLADVGNVKEVRVKTRHGPNFHRASLRRTGADCGRVELESRDKGLAAGQFAAFYDDDDVCLGSGVIADEQALYNAPSTIIPLHAQKNAKRLQAHL